MEAIFDRKHLVLGVRNLSELLVPRGREQSKDEALLIFTTAFFFFGFPLYD